MKKEAWPAFSFTEVLRPSEGWKVEHAIITSYSADLVVVVTALLALTGCDLDHRRTGSRVELVKAIEALRGRVRILAQAGRVAVPSRPRPILKLLDKFLQVVTTNEKERSWHPKVALVRYQRIGDAKDRQWRVWLGSRNLTRSSNWEAGLVLTSRSDARGQQVDGLSALGARLAKEAALPALGAKEVADELAGLTWDCPPGCQVQKVNLFGPGLLKGFPVPSSDTEQVYVVSPFVDLETVRTLAKWGNPKTHRTLVSTAFELQRVWERDSALFGNGAVNFCVLPFPELAVEGPDLLDPDISATVDTAESEDLPPAGLHAKLFFAAKGSRRQLWIGSANATERGWAGLNYEVVAELLIGREAANAVEDFVSGSEKFKPTTTPTLIDRDEESLEQARKLISGAWSLQQRIGESEIEVIASGPPPLDGLSVKLEVAALGGTWTLWASDVNLVVLLGVRRSQRSDFLQIRLSCGQKMCGWLQIAPCDVPPDEDRDRALIAQYLDARTFLMWLRSLLADEPVRSAGGDWDNDDIERSGSGGHIGSAQEIGTSPTVEEILRAWARDASAFAAADEKVKSYHAELERRAVEGGNNADLELLRTFQRTWSTLASELR